MPDPKLKPVIEEIQAVLKKHDVTGIVFVGSATHQEFLYSLEASWSCVKMLNDKKGQGINVRALRADFPSLEAQKKCLEDSIGNLVCFGTLGTRLAEDMTKVLLMLGTKMDVQSVNRLDRLGPPE